VEGQITRIFVKSGDRVESGTPLLQIDPLKQEATVNSQEASRAAQEANLRYAKISLERAQKLFDAGVISKQELDNVQTGYEASLAQLKALDEQVKQQKVELHYYSVTSPMGGIVGDIPVRVGDRVTVATLLTTVDEPGALEAYIYVPAERAKNLKLGLPVRLLENAVRVGVETQVTFVSPQVDTDTQTVLAKATFVNSQAKLRIAQQVRAQITWGIHEGPVIPVLAVQRINGQFFAFVSVKEGNATVARQKPLKLGDTVGNDFAVLDGLKPGDHIIVSGTQFLQDGMPVTEQIQGSGKSASVR
jgi:RND family efflux transporter MFP subunit